MDQEFGFKLIKMNWKFPIYFNPYLDKYLNGTYYLNEVLETRWKLQMWTNLLL